jgi:hypothetical protein
MIKLDFIRTFKIFNNLILVNNQENLQNQEIQKQKQKISWLTISNKVSKNTYECVKSPSKITKTFWLFFTRENGNLYIYNVPNLQLVYMVF